MTHDIDHVLNHISLKKSRRRWRWIAVAAIAALVIGLIAYGAEKPVGDHVARLEVKGLITGDDRQLALIRDMREDDKVKALILRIDSPGGTSSGSEALYEELIAFGAKKPIVAVMDSVAASGGYITALSADRIYARSNTMTGSIGVLFTYPDVSQLLGTVGVKMEEVKSGPLKAEPSGTKPTPEAARAVLQGIVNDGFAWFKGLVQERRRFDTATTDRLSDGRIYSGRQALQEKLVDEIGSELDARKWLETEKKIDAKIDTVTRKPKPLPNESRFDFLFGHALGQAIADATGLSALGEKAEAAKLDGLLVLWHPAL
jgi:protease IV